MAYKYSETLMNSLENKLIVYDSNCKVCSSLRKVILKLTQIDQHKVVALAKLDLSLQDKVDTDRFRNGMALIDTSDGETIYGAEGVAYVFASQYLLIRMLLRIPLIFKTFAFLYKVLAYNRYIIAAPKSRFHCDCFPDKVERYRISYIAIAVLTAFILTAVFGVSIRRIFGVPAADAAWQMILTAGTGWVLQILFAILFLRGGALDYVGHLGSIMVAGLLILMPSVCLYVMGGTISPYVPAISVVISSWFMLHLHLHRVRHLQLSQWWTVSWFLSLQSTALIWVYVFHIKQYIS